MIRIAFAILAILLIALACLSFFVRLYPTKLDKWHVDPETADLPNSPNAYKTFYEFEQSKADLITLMQDLVFGGETVTRISGDLSTDYATYEVRTRLMGYPDYVNLKVIEKSGKSKIYIFSRSRFGHSDFGRNKDRIEQWINRLRQNLGT